MSVYLFIYLFISVNTINVMKSMHSCYKLTCGFSVRVEYLKILITGWERTVHVSRCTALYSGRIFVPLCREVIIFVF